ncbi:MAG: PAS domain S-box protein [Candidatus Marinimicrobia bacterium]|nr:PAS domain S-box protein [Candidatus Neomarinimicrobiota bacterium]
MEIKIKNILLVEDEAIIAFDKKKQIESFGYHVDHVFSGQKAIEKISLKEPVDLILMDIDLGNPLSGVEAAEAILKIKALPIVFLTSHTEEKYTSLAKEIAGYGYVIKNSNGFVLNSSIEMALKLFEAHEKTRRHEAELREQNRQIRFLKDLAYEISTKKHDHHLIDFFITELKNFTRSPLITFVAYDDKKKCLVTKKVETNKDILNKVIAMTNKNMTQSEYLVSDDMYEEITQTIVDVKQTLTECTFGEIPPLVDSLVKSLLKVDRFFLIAYLIEDKLYGTTLIGVQRGLPDLSMEFLKSFAHIAAGALHRIQAEDKLMESEIYFQNILNNISELVYIVDSNGRFTYINDYIFNMTGYTVDEFLGRNIVDFIHSEDIEKVMDKFKEAFSGPMEPYPFRIIHKNGNSIWISGSSRPIYFEKNKISGVTGAVKDISREINDEMQIKSLLREKETLLKEVHHRIKNNMNIIASMLSLQSRTFEDESVKAAFQASASRVKSMMMLYDKLYTTNNYAAMSLNNYLSPLVREIMSHYPDSGRITIHTALTDRVLPVKTLTCIGIIVNELLNNAMKHAFGPSQSGEISILAQDLSNNQISICISDDGIGYDFGVAAEKKHFGMQLIKTLVKQLNGSFEFKSEQGACFCFTFTHPQI